MFWNNKVEDISIPASDLIIASQSLQYVHGIENVIREIYSALNPNGLALLVCTNPNNPDLLIKNDMGRDAVTASEVVEHSLDALGIEWKKEKAEARVFNLSDCFTLNENGKQLISLFFSRPYDLLVEDDVTAFLSGLSRFAPEGEMPLMLDCFRVAKPNGIRETILAAVRAANNVYLHEKGTRVI